MEFSKFADLIINLGRQYGYWIIFFAAVGEGVGLPVPDGVILAISASFVIRGQMSIPGLIIYFLLGNIIGNLIAYSLGRWGKNWAKKFNFVNENNEKRFEKVSYLFARYGAWALLITQVFSRMLRVPVIYTAGAQEMNILKYLTLCTLGNFIWGAFWLFTGLYVSANFQRLQSLITGYENLQFLIGGLLVIAFYFFYRRAKQKI